MQKDSSYHILRVFTAITFLWVGVLILKEPLFWSGFIQPWAADLLPMSPVDAMMGTAILDIVIGILLLVDFYAWAAAGVAALHLAVILAVAGIDSITVRDIGLLGSAVALFWTDLPSNLRAKLKRNGR